MLLIDTTYRRRKNNSASIYTGRTRRTSRLYSITVCNSRRCQHGHEPINNTKISPLVPHILEYISRATDKCAVGVYDKTRGKYSFLSSQSSRTLPVSHGKNRVTFFKFQRIQSSPPPAPRHFGNTKPDRHSGVHSSAYLHIHMHSIVSVSATLACVRTTYRKRPLRVMEKLREQQKRQPTSIHSAVLLVINAVLSSWTPPTLRAPSGLNSTSRAPHATAAPARSAAA